MLTKKMPLSSGDYIWQKYLPSKIFFLTNIKVQSGYVLHASVQHAHRYTWFHVPS